MSHSAPAAQPHRLRRFGLRAAAALACFGSTASAEPKPSAPVAAAPALAYHLEHRSRLEHLRGEFHGSATGNSTGYSMRTLASVEFRHRAFAATLELADSRLYTTDATPRNTTHVNAFEPLQAFVSWRGKGVIARGDALTVQAGRMTMNLGSRRLIARSEYRNTINGFTGVDAQWRNERGDGVRVFAVMPVVRRPSDADALVDNEIELDREATRAWLGGAVYSRAPADGAPGGEAYVLGYAEADTTAVPSANRRLLVPGARLLLPPAMGQLDAQVEVIGQFGRSHASAGEDDEASLRHRAVALHATAGYTLASSWRPRGALQVDYASGDRRDDDNRNNRFDPLFGARRFDFGPTGLWGAIARANVIAPGARVEAVPSKRLDGMLAYRAVWLASTRDAWTVAGLRDATGESGRFVGHQVEARARLTLRPRQLLLELGGAVLTKGDFVTTLAPAQADRSLFAYTQLTGTL